VVAPSGSDRRKYAEIRQKRIGMPARGAYGRRAAVARVRHTDTCRDGWTRRVLAAVPCESGRRDPTTPSSM
jgi:hypothetical protein